uniref:Uncharacterized protein n=1 Tax=uncultured prokaryote TaxID=198431 RepID=A0A0H5Q7R6_9ZZZZ|nr:hypothetical protein [uncultured prokaryote]
MATIQRHKVIWTGVAGSPWYSTFHVADEGNDVQDVSDAIEQWCFDVSNNIYSEITMTHPAEVELIDGATGEITGTIQGNQSITQGVGGVNALPFSTQMVVNMRTAVYVSGRRVQGRFNVPGLTEAANTNSAWDVAVTADVLAAFNTLNAALVPPGLMVLSVKAAAAVPVSAMGVSPTQGVLRSRRD